MASDPIKIDIAYKRLNKKQYTSPDKTWHEEFPGKPLNLKFSDLWIDDIPSTPPLSSTSIIQVLSDLVLTEDITVNNSLSWLACLTSGDLGTRVGDFIQPDQDIPQDYYIRLFDNNGTQIYVGDQVAWEFDYANGILTFEYPPIAFTSPFHIQAYRYIGRKGAIDNLTSSLDKAYDGTSGSGSGRVIEVDSGPVEFNATNGSAALKITPIIYTPNINLEAGQIINREGILYIYDDSRTKWISLQRYNVMFGAKRADGMFLGINDFTSNLSGWPALRDCCITGVTAQASGGYSAKKFYILQNNNQIPVFEFNLSSHYYANGNLNLPFDANDLIKILASSEYATTTNVIINLEIVWAL